MRRVNRASQSLWHRSQRVRTLAILAASTAVLVALLVAACNDQTPTPEATDTTPVFTGESSPSSTLTPASLPSHTAPTPTPTPSHGSIPSPSSELLEGTESRQHEPASKTSALIWPTLETRWEGPVSMLVPLRGKPGDTYNGKSGDGPPSSEKTAIVQTILSSSLLERTGLFVSASKDSASPQYTLVGIELIHGAEAINKALKEGLSSEETNMRNIGLTIEERLFPSRDSENSWEEIILPPGILGIKAVELTVSGGTLEIKVTDDHNSWFLTILLRH